MNEDGHTNGYYFRKTVGNLVDLSINVQMTLIKDNARCTCGLRDISFTRSLFSNFVAH